MNGVEIRPAQDGARRVSGLLVFAGAMDYDRERRRRLSFAARSVLPLVQARRPHARLRIVGRNPGRAVRALARLPGVEVSGEVPDVGARDRAGGGEPRCRCAIVRGRSEQGARVVRARRSGRGDARRAGGASAPRPASTRSRAEDAAASPPARVRLLEDATLRAPDRRGRTGARHRSGSAGTVSRAACSGCVEEAVHGRARMGLRLIAMLLISPVICGVGAAASVPRAPAASSSCTTSGPTSATSPAGSGPSCGTRSPSRSGMAHAPQGREVSALMLLAFIVVMLCCAAVAARRTRTRTSRGAAPASSSSCDHGDALHGEPGRHARGRCTGSSGRTSSGWCTT